MPISRAVSALLGATCLGSCVFFDDVPEHALLLCADDEACPSGYVCDVPSHVCVDADDPGDNGAAPAVESVDVSVPAASDGDSVVITVVADEPLAGAAFVLAPGVLDPGFGDAVIDGMSDASGRQARRAVDDVRFRVDRAPPLLRSLRVRAADASGVIADRPSLDGVIVTSRATKSSRAPGPHSRSSSRRWRRVPPTPQRPWASRAR